MKILYLFNRVRVGLEEKIIRGEEHDGHFFGMFRLRKFGLEAEYLEIEQFLPLAWAQFIRTKIFNVHYVHLPLFFQMRRYDFVFTSTALGTLFLKTFFNLKKPKWVVFDYGIRGMIGNGKTIKQKALKFMINKSDGIITISPGERDVMKEMFPKLAGKIIFLPLGVDTNFFKPGDQNKTQEDFIFSPGRDPGRDLKTLATATQNIIPEVKVTTRASRLAKLGKLADHVKCYDFSTLELRRQYQLAKLFILPLDDTGGLNDAMGCSTLVEAMAMGKAIIATETETVSAYITHGENGWLVPARDPAALRAAITKLLADDALRERLGRAARESAVKNCSADIFAQNLANYFKQNINHE